MAKTPSTMLPLGTALPHFQLPDCDGQVFDTTKLNDCRALIVAFICNHCPYVKHIAKPMSALARFMMQTRGVYFVAISSNDVANYPEDRPELMKAEAIKQDYVFPYLYDESQSVAKAFHAACTPEFYLFDSKLELVYRGQFDGSRPGNQIPPSGQDLKDAFLATISGLPTRAEQIPSLGCNIKWKPGQEPNDTPSTKSR